MWHRNDENLTVEKMEFVTWICLYNLLSCKVGVHSTMVPLDTMTPTLPLQEVMDKYELNDFRVAVLTKLQGKLHDNLVDQVGCDWSLEY